MQENYNEQEVNGGQSFFKSALKWLDNFWYHYKWHSIIALFLIFAVVICTFQMCTKTSYDIHILYAGGYEIKRTSSDGDVSPISETVSTLRNHAASDFDGDGKVNVSFRDLFVLTEEEIKGITAADKNKEINYYLINENNKILRDTLTYSNYYLCFISPALYEEYKVIDGIEIFVPLADLINTGSPVTTHSAPIAARDEVSENRLPTP